MNSRSKPRNAGSSRRGRPQSRSGSPVLTEPERIQKVLARVGLGSRRQIEDLIRAGEIRINGKVAELGQKLGPEDRLTARGRPIRLDRMTAVRRRVLLYYKPEGEVTARHDPQGRRTVFDTVPSLTGARWIAVGRLDINTQGLLLLTTDGELANRLMHPSFEVEREYAVRIKGEITPEQRRALLEGVLLEDGPARFDSLVEEAGQPGEGSNRWYRATLKEGRNREVRRLMESRGLLVSRLIRLRYGPVVLPRNLGRGRWLELSRDEAFELAVHVGIEAPRKTRAAKPGGRHTRRG